MSCATGVILIVTSTGRIVYVGSRLEDSAIGSLENARVENDALFLE